MNARCTWNLLALLGWLFIVPLLLVHTSFADTPDKKRIALVIGNSDYDIAPLRNPENDADDMTLVLSTLGFQVEKLKNTDRRQLIEAIRRFSERLRRSNGEGVFYYSGHGVQVDGENYLIPTAANLRSAEEVAHDSVALNHVLAAVSESGNPTNVVILDACRNNPFASRYRAASRGLAAVDSPNGTFIAFATAPGDVADDGIGRNGVYTKHLLKEMGSPGAAVEEVFKKVRASVMQETGTRQRPWEMSSLTGPFVFNTAMPLREKMSTGSKLVGTASLEIQSVPYGALLFIDGRPEGATPMILQKLPAGWPLLRAEFPDQRIQEQRITLAEGQHARITLLPDAADTSLHVTSEPADAVVLLNGAPAGTTPTELRGLTRGMNHLRISKSGYDDWEQKLDLGTENSPQVAARLTRGVGIEYQDRLTDGSDGPPMVVVKGGCFLMGSEPGEAGRDDDENVHEACLTQPFAMGKFEVTVGDYQRFVEKTAYVTDAEKERGEGCYAWSPDDKQWAWRAGMTWRNPGFAPAMDMPIVCLSWNDARAYARWLSEQTGKTYRLPTEAEWEYAARGGTESSRFWGENVADACRFANVLDQTPGLTDAITDETHTCHDAYFYLAPVGRFRGNGFGLRDVLGNAWEWSCSTYVAQYGEKEQHCDEEVTTIDGDIYKVLRGGSWRFGPLRVRAANRSSAAPRARFDDVGFRLASDL